MKIQDIKDIIQIANYLNIDKRELFEEVNQGNKNFEVDNYTFLTEEEALKEVINMYKFDEYLLGCFNADFIEDFIPLDYESIKNIQDSENYQVIGKLILNSGNIEEMMREYIRLDGYGHALNSYDGNYCEIGLNGINYIYFRNN